MAELDEQLVDLFKSDNLVDGAVDLDAMRALLEAGANPNYYPHESLHLAGFPILTDQEAALDLLIDYGMILPPSSIDMAMRDNKAWALERVNFDDGLAFYVDDNGENWLDQINRVGRDDDVAAVRELLEARGVIGRIETRIAKEEAEYAAIVSGNYTLDAVGSAIDAAIASGVAAHEIPYLNAHTLTAALEADDLALAQMLIERGITPNDHSFVSGDAGVHAVNSAEAVALLSGNGADWSLGSQAGIFDSLPPIEVMLRNDRPVAADAILQKVSGDIDEIRNLDNRIESRAMLDVLTRHGIVSAEDAAAWSGENREAEFSEMLANAGVTTAGLIAATNARTIKIDPITAPELTSDFSIIPSLPDSDAPREEVTLFIIERGNEAALGEEEDLSHQEDTTRVARGVATRLGAQDAENHIIPLVHRMSSSMVGGLDLPDKLIDEPLRAILRSDDVRDGRIIFSQSMGEIAWGQTPANVLENWQEADPTRYAETELDFWDEEINPVVFISVGNDFRYGKRSQDSGMDSHTSRSMEVGSADPHPNGHWVIPEYSSMSGGDILCGIVSDEGELYQGTSFAAPACAAGYRELSARHGFSHGLTYDELVFSMMATTDKNVQTDRPWISYDPRPEEYRLSRQMAINPDPEWVDFGVNGAGIAYHNRAFSGVFNPVNADALAAEMAEAKSRLGLIDTTVREQADIDLHAATQENGEYVYRITAPHDMTLTRLSLYLPQEQNARSGISLETPSGYRFDLPVSEDGMVSTRAFFGEDVEAGQELIIRTSTPLIDHKYGMSEHSPNEAPFIMFRGLEPNNTVAYMRDRMLEDGRLLEPLSQVNGAEFNEAEVTPIVAESDEIDPSITSHGLPAMERGAAGLAQ